MLLLPCRSDPFLLAQIQFGCIFFGSKLYFSHGEELAGFREGRVGLALSGPGRCYLWGRDAPFPPGWRALSAQETERENGRGPLSKSGKSDFWIGGTAVDKPVTAHRLATSFFYTCT
jgi:hypothetical protein